MLLTPNKQFWKVFKETAGALSSAEAIAIINIAKLAPKGVCLELGSHKGKSAMSAAIGLKYCDRFYLVDPIFEDEALGYSVCSAVQSMGDLETRFIPSYSTAILEADEFNNQIYAYVFVDSGSHGDGLPMQEAKLLEDRMIQGGIIAWHDYKNQFVEVEQAYNYLLSTGKYEEIKIDWQPIFDYVKEHNLEDGNNSWHLYPELPRPPNFIGALKRK